MEELKQRTPITIKSILILFLAFLLNITITYTLFAGVGFFNKKTKENAKEYGKTALQEVHYIAGKYLYPFLTGHTDEKMREDDPQIVAYQNLYDVEKYDLSLSFDIPEKSITGELIMRAKALSDTLNNIYINFYDNMTVSDIEIGASDNSSTGGMESASYKRKNNYIIIDTKDKMNNNDEFIVKIYYSGKPKNTGYDSFTFIKVYGSPVVSNLSEPDYAPVWWPCKDMPSDKAVTDVSLRVPTGLKGISGGVLKDTIQNTDGTTTFNWVTHYPIATYLVSAVVANLTLHQDYYTSLDGTVNMPVDYYAFPKDSVKAYNDWKKTPQMIRFFAQTYGEYPFLDEKYGMVEFAWTQGAMEHQTITGIGYTLVTGDGRYEDVVSHELAHQWFGDAVTLLNWKNIWINEGFATYSEALWNEHEDGKDAYFDYMKRIDYGYFTGTVYDPQGYIFSPTVYATVYQKGAWVLHMLRGVVGDSLFFEAVRNYYEKFKYKNTETADLQAVFEEVTGENLDWFFDEWVYKGTGRPRYEYSWKFEDFPGTAAHTVKVQLDQVQTDRDVYKMPVKISIQTTLGEKNFTVFNDSRNQNFIFTTDATPKQVLIDKDGWILKRIAKGKY